MLSNLPTQEMIIRSWKGDSVAVTCLVTCYNHESYIYDCLRGIVLQKTEFPFKVVVYDDYSSDGTREILREFESRYPLIFDIYYAEFNHYKVSVFKGEYIERLEGSYIALCEGDDYWIDTCKLQKQFDVMNDSRQDLCIHPAFIFFEKNGAEDIFCYYGNKKKILPQKAIFSFKNQFAPTASYFMKLNRFLEYLDLRAKQEGGPGDFFMEAISSEKGVIYLPTIMSAYRRGSDGSYSQKQVSLSADEIYSELNNWKKNMDIFLTYRPTLKKYTEDKLKLVEVDYLLRAQLSDKEGNEELAKAVRILNELGPISY